MTKQLIDLNDAPCVVCKAEFRKTDMDDKGRCPLCVTNGLMPGLKTKQDVIQSAAKEYEELKSLVRQAMREIKEEEEAEKKANFAEKLCKQCGKEFVPRAPAAQYCETCHAELKNVSLNR